MTKIMGMWQCVCICLCARASMRAPLQGLCSWMLVCEDMSPYALKISTRWLAYIQLMPFHLFFVFPKTNQWEVTFLNGGLALLCIFECLIASWLALTARALILTS